MPIKNQNKQKNKNNKKIKILIGIGVGILVAVILYLVFVIYIPTNKMFFKADYGKTDLSAMITKEVLTDEDYEEIFYQTGLGKIAVDELFSKGEEESLFFYQEFFLKEREPSRRFIIDPVTYVIEAEDENGEKIYAPEFASLKEGDILVSICTSTLGYLHGHTSMYLGNDRIIESYAIGTLSNTNTINSWGGYSNYAVLRVKEETDKHEEVAIFAEQYLQDKAYSLTAGVLEQMDLTHNDEGFTTQCAFLPWYAWNEFGINIDGDEGAIVTPLDLLFSDKLEIVQIYGFDPTLFE